MAEPATTYAHITVDEHGIPWIAGANTKVVELVAEVHAYGWSPEERLSSRSCSWFAA
jgi:hypothetical protein